MRPNRVCMIAYSEYSSDARIRREAEALAADHRFKVTVVALKEAAKPRSYHLDRVQVTEVPLRKYRGQSRWRYFLTYCVFAVLSFVRCAIILFTQGLDVVHVHNMPDFLVVGAAIPRLLGKKLVLDIHDSMPETYQAKFGSISRYAHRLLCLEELFSCAFASKVISVNGPQRDVLMARGVPPGKIQVLLNVPDPRIFPHNTRQANSTDTKAANYNIVYHGTVDRMLGLDLAIQAVGRLVDKIPNLRLHILGVGRDWTELHALAIHLGLADHIHFSRRIFSLEALPRLLGNMHLGIIPNRRNPATELMLPVKMLEYVALGIPVVAPRLKTIQYYFADDMVCYFAPDNVDSMTAAIYAMYNDKHRTTRQAINAGRFLEQFGWEKHRLDFLKFYEGFWVRPQ
jgi:glycosyltransferase involved in cell wall biosynthesis